MPNFSALSIVMIIKYLNVACPFLENFRLDIKDSGTSQGEIGFFAKKCG